MVPLFNLIKIDVLVVCRKQHFANVILWCIRFKASNMHLQDTFHNVYEWITEMVVEY